MSKTPQSPSPGRPDWLHHEDLLLEFENAWQSGEPPDLADFLPDNPEQRRIVLSELVAIDLEYRTGRGESIDLEDYLSRYPELALSEDPFPDPHREPTQLGRYELGAVVGRGGFATVYRGWDTQLHREVAVKIPHPGRFDRAEFRARLLREARSAAQLRHPAIVPIHEVGEQDGRPFIVYEFIPGPTLAQLVEQTNPAPEQCAAWVARLGDALHYSHQNGIVHRDVKPANVMMDAKGEPVLADFGLAHLESPGDTTLTREGDIIGTPAYMSPEQARGDIAEVDARSDVYSLGALLYELLCGRRPFEGSGTTVLLAVIHDEPPSVRSVRSNIPADLETICLEAMAKEPHRRYATAAAFADDLRRYLNHEPICARRVGPLVKLWLWIRRNPALAATITTAMVLIATVATIAFCQVLLERNRYLEEKQNAQANLYDALLGQAKAEMKARDTGWWWRVMDKVGQAARLDVGNRDAFELRNMALECMSVRDPCFRHRQTWVGHRDKVTDLSADPTGTWVVSASADTTIRLWRVGSATRALCVLDGHQAEVRTVAFDPTGKWFASGSADGVVFLWDLASCVQHERRTPVGVEVVPASVNCVAWSSTGMLGVARDDGVISLFQPSEDGRRLDPKKELTGHSHSVNTIAFRPGGKVLVSGSDDRTLRSWDVAGGKPFRRRNLLDPIGSVAFDRRGVQLGWCEPNNFGFNISLYDRPTADGDQNLLHKGGVLDIAWSDYDLFTASADGTLRVWRGYTQKAIARAESGAVHCVVPIPGTEFVLAGYADGCSRLWQLSQSPFCKYGSVNSAADFLPGTRSLVAYRQRYDFDDPTQSTRYVPPTVTALGVSASEDCMAIGDQDGGLRFWNREHNRIDIERMGVHTGAIVSVETEPNGDRVLSASHDGTVKLWRWNSELLASIPTELGKIWKAYWSPEGDQFGAVGEDGVVVWDVSPRTRLRWRIVQALPSGGSLAFSKDVVAYTAWDSRIVLLDRTTGKPVRGLVGHEGIVLGLAFSPDGRLLLSCDSDNTVRLWNPTTGDQLAPAKPGRFTGSTIVWHPRLPYFLIGGDRGGAYLWDANRFVPVAFFRHSGLTQAFRWVDKGKTLLFGGLGGVVCRIDFEHILGRIAKRALSEVGPVTFELYDDVVPGDHLARVWGVATSPNGKWFATAGHDARVKLWDAKTNKLLHTFALDGIAWDVAFSPDSKFLATGASAPSANGDTTSSLVVWDVETRTERFRLEAHTALVIGVEFHPSGRWLASAGADGCVFLWDVLTASRVGRVYRQATPVRRVRFSPDGKRLFAALESKGIGVWSFDKLLRAMRTGAPPSPKLLTAHRGSIRALGFDHTGNILASATNEGHVMLWDGRSLSPIAFFRTEGFPIRKIVFSDDASLLVAATYAKRAPIWHLDRIRRRLREMNLDWD